MISGTYTLTIGEETVTLTMSGDSTSTSGSFSLSQGSGNVMWNVNGIYTTPNGEKAVISGGGNPALYANAAVKIYTTSTELVTIDDKFIPSTIVRTEQLGGVRFRIIGTDLQVSLDDASTWKTVTLT
jgi:hypothetical protein